MAKTVAGAILICQSTKKFMTNTKPKIITKICQRCLGKSRLRNFCECGGGLHEMDSETGVQLVEKLNAKKASNSGSHGSFGNKPKKRKEVNPHGELATVATIQR